MSNYLNLDVGTPNMYYNEDSQENTPTQQSTSDALYITSNLNTFYDRMYGYYYQGGIRNIMLNIHTYHHKFIYIVHICIHKLE